MNNATPDWVFQSVINDLQKSGKGVKTQKTFEAVMSILILGPIVASGVLVALNVPAYIIVIMLVVCYALVVILGISRKKSINKSFYKIADAYKKFDLHEADEEKVKELYNDSALTFFGVVNNNLLNFVYNWLNYEDVLKNDQSELDIYIFDGSVLNNAFPGKEIDENVQFACIFLKDLNINDSNKDSFTKDHTVVGSRWLDDIIGNNE